MPIVLSLLHRPSTQVTTHDTTGQLNTQTEERKGKWADTHTTGKKHPIERSDTAPIKHPPDHRHNQRAHTQTQPHTTSISHCSTHTPASPKKSTTQPTQSNDQTNDRTSKRTNERTNERSNERTNEQTTKQPLSECSTGWVTVKERPNPPTLPDSQ